MKPGEIYWVDLATGRRPGIGVSRESLNQGNDAVMVLCTTKRFAIRSKLPNCVPFQAGEFGMPSDCVAQREAIYVLVDYTGRVFREGKAAISRGVAEIFERLGSSAETWQARLERLSQSRLLGRFFATSRMRLREVAERLGLRRVPNLAGCAAS